MKNNRAKNNYAANFNFFFFALAPDRSREAAKDKRAGIILFL